MIGWIMQWVWWFTWRVVVTFACMATIQNVIQQEGYRVEWSTMVAASVCAIVGIRVWMPFHSVSKNSNQG